MEEIRKQAVERLGELQKIKPRQYTAMELRPGRQMLGRVQRKEQVGYYQRVQEQKAKLRKDIAKIDAYSESVRAQDKYLAKLPKKPKRGKQGKKGKGYVEVLSKRISIAPVVLPAPTIVFGRKPKLRKTRLQRSKRRRR